MGHVHLIAGRIVYDLVRLRPDNYRRDNITGRPRRRGIGREDVGEERYENERHNYCSSEGYFEIRQIDRPINCTGLISNGPNLAKNLAEPQALKTGPGVLLKTSVLLLDYLGKGSCFDRSVSSISRYDNTRRRALTFEKLERGRYCAVAEESLPMSNRHRIYFQTELVNEIIL